MPSFGPCRRKLGNSGLRPTLGGFPLWGQAKLRHSILIADDDWAIRKTVVALLRDAGYHCSEAVDGFDAMEKAAVSAPDLIVLDLRMPRALKERLPQTKILLLTAYDVGHSLAASVGVDTVVRKSDGAQRLVDCVRELLVPQTNRTTPRSDSPPTTQPEEAMPQT